MRDSFKTYFDSNMLLEPGPDNKILFTSEYCSLAQKDDQLTQKQVLNLLRLINPTASKDIWSRDNHFGFIALSKRFGLNYHKKMWLGDIKYLLQPSDVIFFMYATEGFLSFLAFPLLFISSIAMILTVFLTSYETINDQQVLNTSGKILTWLTINSFNLPITKKICDFIVKKKFGSYQVFLDIYFADPNHPIRVLAKEQSV